MSSDLRDWCAAVVVTTYRCQSHEESAAIKAATEFVVERKPKLRAGAHDAIEAHKTITRGALPECLQMSESAWLGRIDHMSTRIERAEAARGEHPLLDEELDEDVLAFGMNGEDDLVRDGTAEIETVPPQLSNATNDPEEPIELVYHLAEEPTSEPALDTPAVTDAAGVVPVVDPLGVEPVQGAAQIAGRTAEWLDLEATRHVYNLANTLSQSRLIPEDLQGNATDTFVVLLTGRDLGITAMQALRGLSVIKGKVAISADLLVALVRRSPDCEYFRLVETTATGATYETKRLADPEPMRISWDIETAKRAKLWGSHTWSKYPRAMFRARTSAELARAMYPEVVLGLYTLDEGEEIAA